MYNKKFDIEIMATTPFAFNEGEESKTGITITGKVKTDDKKFLDDIFLGKNKAGLKSIIDGTLPIEGNVSLKFSLRDDEMITLPKVKERIPCQVNHIEVGKADLDGNYEVKLKIKLPHTASKIAGEVVSVLRQSISIQIDSDQKELFD